MRNSTQMGVSFANPLSSMTSLNVCIYQNNQLGAMYVPVEKYHMLPMPVIVQKPVLTRSEVNLTDND